MAGVSSYSEGDALIVDPHGYADAFTALVTDEAVEGAVARALAMMPSRAKEPFSQAMALFGPASRRTTAAPQSVRSTLPGGLQVADGVGPEAVGLAGGGSLVVVRPHAAELIAALVDGSDHELDDLTTHSCPAGEPRCAEMVVRHLCALGWLEVA